MQTVEYNGPIIVTKDKKLSCRTETVRCFVSLNISLSHSRSLKVIRNDALEQGVCKSGVFHCNYVCISYTVLRYMYSASNNGGNLKSGLGIVQGH